MNVFYKVCSTVLVLICFQSIPIDLAAQDNGTYYLETYINEPVSIHVISSLQEPAAYQPAQNGTINFTQVDPENGVYKITYTPSNGFIGDDFFEYVLFNSPFGDWTTFSVSVKPSIIDALPDFVTTTKNTPIDIEVLANDEGTGSEFTITGIGLVNFGSASIEPASSLVNFQPANDFIGLATFNYTVCDEFGSCDQGTVTIQVNDDELLTGTDTTNIFTKKNQSQVAFIPAEYNIIQEPTNGSYDWFTNAYIPASDFVGQDLLVAEKDGHQIRVEVTVLDFVEIKYATNDKVYTTPVNSIEFNVLDNDRSTSCFELVNQPENGTLTDNIFPRGSLTYVPNDGFTGVDKFSYRIKGPGCSGDFEYATVEVYVSDYEPSTAKFFMITPKRTPIVIGYNIPISNFGFEVKDQGEIGKAYFLSGEVDTVIYDQPITGNNLIIYIPDEEIITGKDEFEIEYCLSSGNTCAFSQAVKIEVIIIDKESQIGDRSCIDDCVWPGDTNFDGVVNMKDLLSLGLAIGKSGPVREEADLSNFYGQYAADWGEKLNSNTINLKHLDADGNSIVSGEDTLAISKFYGLTHDLTAVTFPTIDYQIKLVGDVSVYPGDLVELSMILGSPENPVIDVYGFTFPFQYNAELFQENSANISFDPNSWLAYNSPVLQMQKDDALGLVETGFTRTNSLAASGYGEIGKLAIVVAEDIAGFRPDDEYIDIPIGGGIGEVSNSAGGVSGALIGETMIRVNLVKPEEAEAIPLDDNLLKVYPNPARQFINIHLNGMRNFNKLVLYNGIGQVVKTIDSLDTNHAQLNVNDLNNGFYVLNVYTVKGVLNRKIEVVRN